MAAKLAPIFNDAQFNNNGVPLSGGLLTWYQANSSTVAITYTDSAGTIPQSNPIILNARGEPESPIWLQTGSNYKAILSDASGVTIRIVDNLSGVNDTSAPIISEWVLFTGSATYIGTTSFSVAGDQTTYFTAARRIKASVSGGVCYATITTAVYASSKTTVTVVNDSVTLDSGIGSVYYGFMDPTHPSFNTAVSSYASTAGSAGACTGNSVTATSAAACSGNAATATTLSGNTTNWATLRTTAVSNMVGWKNFGNNYVIFDASAGTSPTGSAVNNSDSATVWQATYPTLMGWNGSGTYGVRVDSARLADSAPKATANTFDINFNGATSARFQSASTTTLSLLIGTQAGGHYFDQNGGYVCTGSGSYIATTGGVTAGGQGSFASVTTSGAITAGTTIVATSNIKGEFWVGGGSTTASISNTGYIVRTSDSSLKQEDLTAPIPGLAEILQLQPKAYKWLEDIEENGDKAFTEIGFFADQVAPIIPSAAPKGRDGLYGFYDRAVIATLVKATQEQQVLITALTERITALEAI